MLFSEVSVLFFVFEKTKHNPKLTVLPQITIGNEKSGSDDEYYYESLWENVSGAWPQNWIPLTNFIGTYWFWQFDERIVYYLESLSSLIESSLIKSIYWVLVITSGIARRKKKNLIWCLASRRGGKWEIHFFCTFNQDLVFACILHGQGKKCTNRYNTDWLNRGSQGDLENRVEITGKFFFGD